MGMDPLSITVACASLTLAIARTGRSLTALYDKYQNARRSIFLIQTECAVLAAALSHLEISTSGKHASRVAKLPRSVSEALDHSLTACSLTLAVLEKEIERIAAGEKNDTSRLSLSRRVKYVWKDESMTELLQQLRGQSSAITLLLKALDQTSIDQILNIVQSGQQTFQNVQRGAASIRSAHPEHNHPESIIDITVNDDITIYSLEPAEGVSNNLAGQMNRLSTFEFSLFCYWQDIDLVSPELNQSLPSGWEAFYSELDDRWFYVQASNQKISWTHPGTKRPTSSSESRTGDVILANQSTGSRPKEAKSPNRVPQTVSISDSHGETLVNSHAQGIDFAPWSMNSLSKLEAQLDSLMKSRSASAMVVGIVAAEGAPELFIRGVRRFDQPIPVTRSDQWLLGLNDYMTNMALAIMIDQDLLSWDDKLADLLPALRARMHAFHENTTLAMLASHRSGLSDDLAAAEEGDLQKYLERSDISGKEGHFATACSFLCRPPEFEPNSKSAWSFANSMLIAFILEEISGQEIEQLLKRLVFDPLEMYSAEFGWPYGIVGQDQSPPLPWPHDGITQKPLDASLVSRGFACSHRPWKGLRCSASAFSSFLRLQLRCAMGLQTGNMLQPKTMERFQARTSNDPNDFNCAGWKPYGQVGKDSNWDRWVNGVGTYMCARIIPSTGKAYFALSNTNGENGSRLGLDAMVAASRYDGQKATIRD